MDHFWNYFQATAATTLGCGHMPHRHTPNWTNQSAPSIRDPCNLLKCSSLFIPFSVPAHRWQPCSGLTITCSSAVKAQETLHCGPGQQRHRMPSPFPWRGRHGEHMLRHAAPRIMVPAMPNTSRPWASEIHVFLAIWVFCIWNLGLQES